MMPNGPEQTSLSGQPIPPDGSGVSKSTLRRVVGASFIGNFVEWFDYAVYGYLAVTISAVFFPEADKQTALLLTFGLFAISFFVRPIGGFIWGHIGDRVGRKNALSLSILIMSAATFAIGLIPDYGSIGIWAPIMLLIVRVVQGFSAAGEYAGASAFLVEYAPANRRGLYAAVVPASTATGLLLGSLIALLEDEAIKAPVMSLFREQWRPLLIAVGAVVLNAVGFYVVLGYMPTYLSEVVGLDASLSFIATTVALTTYIGFIFLTGIASDRFGRKRVLISASILFVVLTVPSFMLLSTGSFLIVILVQILLGAMLTLNDGTLPSFLAELFPTKVRYSGFAVSFNLTNAIFGGTALFVSTLLVEISGSKLAPGWYLMAAAVVSLIAVSLAKETSKAPLKH